MIALCSCHDESCNLDETNITPKLNPYNLKVDKIDQIFSKAGRSCAFTDLIFYDDYWYVVFRESDKHVFGEDGEIVLLRSKDNTNWAEKERFKVDGVDLRDPKFLLHNDELSIIMHGSVYRNKKLVSYFDYKSKLMSNNVWSTLERINLLGNGENVIDGNEAWPWRLTPHNDICYTIAYSAENKICDLYYSFNGNDFLKSNVINHDLSLRPSEGTIRINDYNEFYLLLRMDKGKALVGHTLSPLKEWNWSDTIPVHGLGGPNFLLVNDNQLIITGRENIDGDKKMIIGLYEFAKSDYIRLIVLPSGGDCSYAGMIINKNILWVSYYSSHEQENGSSIYLAKVSF
jgi:hypothetical protein